MAAGDWVIVTDVGGRTFAHAIRTEIRGQLETVVWCASLDKARRFYNLGELAEWLAFIPEQFEAYEVPSENARSVF